MFSRTVYSAALVQVPNGFNDRPPLADPRPAQLELEPSFILFDSRLAIVPRHSDEHVLGHRSRLWHFCSLSGDNKKADDSEPQTHSRAQTGCTYPKEGVEPGLFFGRR